MFMTYMMHILGDKPLKKQDCMKKGGMGVRAPVTLCNHARNICVCVFACFACPCGLSALHTCKYTCPFVYMVVGICTHGCVPVSLHSRVMYLCVPVSSFTCSSQYRFIFLSISVSRYFFIYVSPRLSLCKFISRYLPITIALIYVHLHLSLPHRYYHHCTTNASTAATHRPCPCMTSVNM